MRRKMIKEAAERDFEINLVREIVLITKEMSWTIDYTLDLGILRYNQVKDAIAYSYEQQNKANSQGNKPSANTLGGL